MTKTKTASTAARRNAPGQANPAKPANVDDAIQQAQQGSVAVTPERAIEMASTLFGQKKFGQAEKVCRQVIASRPGNADAHNILGVTLDARGQSAEGIEMLRRATELAPKAANIHANLGELLRRQGELEEASEVLEKAAELDPRNSQALNNLGITYFERGQPDKAAEQPSNEKPDTWDGRGA